MPYLFRLKPNAAQTPTFDEYAARFLAAGLQPFGVQSPNVRAFCIKNLGAVVVKDAPEERGLYAEALIGLVTLGWNATDIRPRVEVWLRVAEETDSVIFDGHTMDALVDEVSIASCVERVVAKRRACFKGGPCYVPRHFDV